MSIVFRIAKDEGIALDLWDGIVTADEYLASAQRLLDDVDWPPHRHLHLGDLQTASPDPSLNESALSRVAEIYGQHLDVIANTKSAIVANQAFSQSFFFQQLMASSVSMAVFNDLSTACLWLGIEAEWADRVLSEMRAQLPSR
jgi:hypothetical protein